jgi:hypothetical protein
MSTHDSQRTVQTATETNLLSSSESRGGYEASRFNAVRHGVLSGHTLLPWEDKEEYESLLQALVEEHAPHGPTEDHLVEEIAGVFWRKRRLRLAETALYRGGLVAAAAPLLGTLDRALSHIERTGLPEPVIEAITATPLGTAKVLDELKKRQASAQIALEILNAGRADAYEAGLAELHESTRGSWEEQLTPEPEDLDKDEDLDGDGEPYRADATGLAGYLEDSVLPYCARQLRYVENRQAIRSQVIGELLYFKRLDSLSRYEVHLDRKLERMLTMLLRLQDLRRSKESG